MIRSTLAGALQRKNIQSVYIKILMNHLQLIVLTASFDFDWPKQVIKLFDTSKPVAQVSDQIISFDWFLDQRSNGSTSGNLIRLYYQKMIMYAALPIIMALWWYMFWSWYFCNKRRSLQAKKVPRIMASLIILFFLIHPTIVQYMFSNFNWMDIDGTKRVIDDLEVVCWGAEHINYSMMIDVPSLVIWGFGIPAFAWIVLARNKENLDLIETREKYGFLYNGYKKKYYYWESVNMYRKITVIFISVFLRVAGVITQALVIFLVLILFLILNIKLMPFTFKSLNDMEMLSIITCMLTIYWGLYYISDQPEVYQSSDSTVKSADNGLRLNQTYKWFFFIIILLCNVLFLAYWTYKMIDEVKNTVRTKLGKVYLYVCLCGNKRRYEDEKRKREIEDENDVLKEEFDQIVEGITSLVGDGKIILNRINIEKIRVYLAENRFIDAITEFKKPTEDEIKTMKRNKRKYQVERMRNNLIHPEDEFDTIDGEGNTFNNKIRPGTDNIDVKATLEQKVDEFLCLPNITDHHRKHRRFQDEILFEINNESNDEYNETSAKLQGIYQTSNEEYKTKQKPQYLAAKSLSSAKSDNSINSPLSNANLNEVKPNAIRTLEHSITQEAEQLGVLMPHRHNSQKQINIEESKQSQKSQKGHLKVIKENPMEDEKMNQEKFLKEKSELHKQEMLFQSRLRANKSNLEPHPSLDLLDQPRISRVKVIKKPKFKDVSLKIEFDDANFFENVKDAVVKREDVNNMSSVDDLKDLENVEIYSEGQLESKNLDEEYDDDLNRSVDERVDF